MCYLYTSATGSTVNIGPYVVSVTGVSFDEQLPELDTYVGTSINRVQQDELGAEVTPPPFIAPAPYIIPEAPVEPVVVPEAPVEPVVA